MFLVRHKEMTAISKKILIRKKGGENQFSDDLRNITFPAIKDIKVLTFFNKKNWKRFSLIEEHSFLQLLQIDFYQYSFSMKLLLYPV
jgi:hypothetical protein